MPRALRLSLVVLALLASGCRFDVVAGLSIDRDGASRAEVLLRVDAAALAQLDDLGVDPTAELAATAAQVPEWQVVRETEEDGALTVRLVRDADDAMMAAEAFRELSAGLSPQDPALLIDLDVVVDADGAMQLEGTAELRPPSSPGARLDGEPVGPDAAALARLTAEAVSARFSVSPPGELVEHDADTVEAGTAIWELIPGEPRGLNASAAAPTGVPEELLVSAALVLLLVAAGLLIRWSRRRR